MTTFLLVRHAAHAVVGQELSGQRPGVQLSAEGQRQAQALAAELAAVPLQALYSSPLERTMATAELIAAAHNLPVNVEPDIAEINFGTWTGRTFTELSADPQWTYWNTVRSLAVPPEGEPMVAVQQRALTALLRLHTLHPEQHIAIVSHCDVIRAILAYCLMLPLDALLRFSVMPASVSTVRFFPQAAPHVLQINHLPQLVV